jgi:hypothetical protein
VIKHLLAYGQSDQASFRDPALSSCFDTMTVPGTIASYFEDATAAFVLTLQKPYLIDPRTPLFQDSLNAPRASHETLADWHGASVATQIQAGGSFPAAFYSPPVVDEMVAEIVGRQRNYGGKAAGIAPKMDRYLRLLAEARGEPVPDAAQTVGAAPDAVLLPYFAVTDLASPWWDVTLDVWRAARLLPDAHLLRPVMCVGGSDMTLVQSVNLLDDVLARRPTDLANQVSFWITDFDERAASEPALTRLWEVVQSRSDSGLSLTNLYGGFYSICLGLAGLAAFGNGLGYSESRRWPALDATGAAPARYYLRDLHMFAPLGKAETLVSRAPAFLCDCPACTTARGAGRSIVSMDYAELKAHFAYARQWEMRLVDTGGLPGVVAQLDAALATFQATPLPPGIKLAVDHMDKWARVLRVV